MSWSVGYDENWKRDIGYDVPCECDHPECNLEIHRGLAYVCGSEPYGGEYGCGLYFCYSHLYSLGIGKGTYQLCDRCLENNLNYDCESETYPPKPDLKEWVEWKLTDKSWEEWRKRNLKEVKLLHNKYKI